MPEERKSLFERLTSFRPGKRRRRPDLFGQHTLADAGFRPREAVRPNPVVLGISRLGAIGLLLARTLRVVITARVDRGESMRVAHRFTNGSIPFIVVAMAFVGMIMVYQSTEQLARAIGDTQLVGASFLKLLIRVLGPTVIGLLLACRVGAGIAAEIGAMAVTDQLDAMRMCAAEPTQALIVPRLRGGVLASVALVIIGSAASAVAGLVTGVVIYATSPGTYWNFDLVSIADVIQGFAKAFCYGIAVPIVSGACGLAARGGARGVGQATTDAVVGSSFSVVALDSLISFITHAVVER